MVGVGIFLVHRPYEYFLGILGPLLSQARFQSYIFAVKTLYKSHCGPDKKLSAGQIWRRALLCPLIQWKLHPYAFNLPTDLKNVSIPCKLKPDCQFKASIVEHPVLEFIVSVCVKAHQILLRIEKEFYFHLMKLNPSCLHSPFLFLCWKLQIWQNVVATLSL